MPVWLSLSAPLHSPTPTNLTSLSYVSVSTHSPLSPLQKVNLRQQSHLINLPNTQPNRQNLHPHIHRLDQPQLLTCALALKSLEHAQGVEEAEDWSLESHKDHHDGEHLKRVAGHVHHEARHWEGFDWCEGHLPGFLDFEEVGFFRGGRLASRFSGDRLLS